MTTVVEALPTDQIIMRPFGPKAWRFIARSPKLDRKYTIAEGSVRSSKTFMADAKLITQYSQYEVPGKRFIAGVSKETVHRNMLIDLFSIVGQENYSYNMSTGELWIFGKQYFVVGARDEASYKKILGATIGLFIGDEIVEFPKSFLAQVWMRMSPDGARMLGTTNPGNPYSYLKADVIDVFPPEKLEIIHFTLDDNPNISKEAKKDIIASQTGVFKLRYIDGLWVVAEGSIYRDAWDDYANQFNGTVKVHGKEVPLDDEPIGLRAQGGHVDHWFSVDAGVDHPQVHLEFYDDGDVIWVTREQVWDSKLERRQKTDGEYSQDLKDFGAEGCEIRVPPEAASLRNQLLLDGFWVVDADNAVSEGIHTVSTLLARRKLRFSKTGCPRTTKRMPTYAWNDKSALRGVEEPLKKEDDEPDAARYGVHGKIPIWRVAGES